jgi:hypothetical protein
VRNGKNNKSEARFVFLIKLWNLILFLSEWKNSICYKVIKNYTFTKHLVILAKINLLVKKSIYWPRWHLASESEQIKLKIIKTHRTDK